ncbi:MAG: hypothetical protein PVH63_11550 [Balneolaceae bacterium]|jgi:hypothetical protein
MKWIKKAIGSGLILQLLVLVVPVQAQQAQLSLDIQVNESLANSQSIDVQSLVSNEGSGPTLFQVYLTNENPTGYAKNLYLEVIIRSDKVGEIAHATQIDGQPFSLSPGQRVYATNNSISNGLPGVEEEIQFEGGLTSAGKDFVSGLQGSLPADRYSVELNIYQGGSQRNRVATATAELGTNIAEDTQGFYLLAPGDAVGSNTTIANRYPNFQWQGAVGTSFRLLVVESKGDESPQSLLEGAASTPPISTKGGSGGALVDYEMLDIVLDGSSFQYPNSGVQSLKPGKTYYWRIIRQLKTGNGLEQRASEIWSFSIADKQKSMIIENTGELVKALKTVLGDKYEQLERNNYSFQSVEIDGQIYQGGQALQKLLELSRSANNGDVSILIEE